MSPILDSSRYDSYKGVTAMLTSSVANEIAVDTSAIIGFNVLITDRDGMVIGSGDPSRVGSFHEASVEVVRRQTAMSHDPDAARRLVGVEPGITLPLVLDGEAVGTVGITGSPGQVERFGRLVRNQTEILLRESVLLSSRLFREKAVEDLLRNVAHYDRETADPGLLTLRAHELGYDLRQRRVVVVVDVETPAEPTKVVRALRRVFDDPQDIVGSTSSGRFVVLHMEKVPVADRCARVPGEIGTGCKAGIGGRAQSVPELHDSYQDASTALYLAERLAGAASVVHIDDLRVHELVASSGRQLRARFVRALAGELSALADWPILRQTIITWCECGFNLVRAAAELRIHRNTVVYRLNKIEELTGHSTRDARFVLKLYLACVADHLDSRRP
ncbi:carbohydrate diacid regulator [Kibdelosporangium banguiense]|uniref:Carbohydrate diacid regulator n=1 Tax=Kibdelosporangium banguiense TaxID=1365924 RepID=A0ABS4TFA4_9PSEU|nr:sugar diacid recognition domain-containing protein [Kibdelosporangium banguiense]MBP2323102.1 carbohydrate diacid regulator [Kibdelosporangium banguiense]